MNDPANPPPASPSPADEHPERMMDPVEPAVAAPRRGWAPPRAGRTVTVLTIAFMVVGLFLVLYAWGLPPFSSATQTTDDAYVRGQTTVIAPQVSGYVVAVDRRDYDTVRKGDVIARIDDRIYRSRVAQAEAQVLTQQAALANSQQAERSSVAQREGQAANIAAAKAQLARAEADMRRVNELVGQGSVSLRERDQTLATLRQAQAAVLQAEAQTRVSGEAVNTVRVGRKGLEANVEAAQAALRLAQIDLDNTSVRAPQDGRLGEVGVRLGQYVTAGSQLTFLVPPVIWVAANFKEAQTAHMAPGQPARFAVDALGGATIHGRVDQLAPAAGSEFQVIRSDNATGNFVKVPQRITVRIAVDPHDPLAPRLRPGMSVVAKVDTHGGPGT